MTDENAVLQWEILLYWDIGEEMKTCLEWNDAAVLKQIRKLLPRHSGRESIE